MLLVHRVFLCFKFSVAYLTCPGSLGTEILPDQSPLEKYHVDVSPVNYSYLHHANKSV